MDLAINEVQKEKRKQFLSCCVIKNKSDFPIPTPTHCDLNSEWSRMSSKLHALDSIDLDLRHNYIVGSKKYQKLRKKESEITLRTFFVQKLKFRFHVLLKKTIVVDAHTGLACAHTASN